MATTTNIERCTAAAINLVITNEAPEGTPEWQETQAEKARIMGAVDKYLSKFAAPVYGKMGPPVGGVLCVCGVTLTGLLGSFQYGLAHGEGRCAHCGHPARANHYIKDENGNDLLTLNAVLLYHPAALATTGEG